MDDRFIQKYSQSISKNKSAGNKLQKPLLNSRCAHGSSAESNCLPQPAGQLPAGFFRPKITGDVLI